MNSGKTIFSQILNHAEKHRFDVIVNKYKGKLHIPVTLNIYSGDLVGTSFCVCPLLSLHTGMGYAILKPV